MNLAADAALKDFQRLKNTNDFINEGKENFNEHLNDQNAKESICFVWYLSTEEEEKQNLSA